MNIAWLSGEDDIMGQSIGEKFRGSLDKLGAVVDPKLSWFSHWSWFVGLAMVSVSVIPLGANKNVSKNVSTTAGTTLNVVAHGDDDLLFLSPDLQHAIQAGRNVRTVFLTAGDSSGDAEYWKSRETGIKAAYAQMSSVSNSWTQTDAGIAEHPIPVFTLSEYPYISLAFMRLPDGNFDGTGFSSTNHESLGKLWKGKISTIHAIDGSSSYTKETLISTLASLMASFQPDQINTLDYAGTYGDGDHSDHHTVAYLVQTTVQQYTTPHRVTGYEGYNTSFLPANVNGTDLIAKQKAFYTYAEDDLLVHSCTSPCYVEWLQRQYTVGPRWRQGRWRTRMPARLVLRLISKLHRRYLAFIIAILIGGTMLTQVTIS